MTTNRIRTATSCVLMAVVALSACHQAADLTEQPRPAATRPVLSLREMPGTGDTLRLALTLETSSGNVIGSLTSDVSSVREWRFVTCAGAQGNPLLACHASDGVVKLAAAWVEGAANGAIITLTFVRASPAGATADATAGTTAAATATAARDWQLVVQEAHSVGGELLTSVLDVRRELVK